MQDIQKAIVVVSDVHLLEEGDSKAKLLLEALGSLDPQRVRYLVLLGDIFDFCFGASPYFQKKFAEFGQQLQRLGEKGIRVVFVQGNHEFAIADIGWKGVEFVSSLYKVIELEGGTKIAFTHGDRVGAPWHYHLYLAVTRSRIFKVLGRLVPPSQLDRLALFLARQSRAKDRYRRLDHRRIIGKLSQWFEQSQCDFGVVGHFHVPYEIEGKIFGLKSWDEPNVLTFDGSSFHRHYFRL